MPRTHYQPSWSAAILLAVCGAVLGSAAQLRADHIDEELIRRAPKLMKQLRERGYQNVGVHTFELKKGDAKPSLQGGTINANLASRVENALVLALNPEEKPIGIIKDASAVAAKKLKDASYRSAEDRAKLFGVEYPLAWGTPPKMVSADAFLVGRVSLSSDLRKTTLLVCVFDRTEPAKLVKLDEFEVATDRYILSDAGQGFSLSKGKGGFRRGMSDEDIFATISEDDKARKGSSGAAPEPKPVDPPAKNPKTTDADGPVKNPTVGVKFPEMPVELTVLYNGQAQALTADGSATGLNNWTMRDPREGEKVSFTLRNKTDKTVGVVLTVNGISTLYEESGQPDQMTRWVLEPGKEYTVSGYYQKEKNSFIEIEGLSDEVSREVFQDFGGARRAGLIHMYVFRPTDGVVQSGGAPAFSRSMRSVSRPVLANTKPQTPAELQKLISASASLKGGRGLIGPTGSAQQANLEEKPLGSVGLTDTLVIRYFRLP